MKAFLRTSLALLIGCCCATTALAQSTYTLDALTSFGPRGDGSIQPSDSLGINPQNGASIIVTAPGFTNQAGASLVQSGDVDKRSTGSTNGYNMRGIACDPVTGNLILVDPHSGQAGSANLTNFAALYVLDPDSGQIIGALSTNGMVGGNFSIVVAGVADDGVVYVCDQTTGSTSTGFKIYRWSSATNFTDPPVVAFTNTLAPNSRIGQTMDVRGSGLNTQIIVGTANNVGNGTNCFLFTTSDGTNFTSHLLSFPGINSAVFNDGIAFGPGNTLFAKQVGGPLVFLWFDPVTFSAGVISQFSASSTTGTDPLSNLAGIAVDVSNHLLAGLEEIGGVANGGRGKVWLFDIANITNQAPAILSSRTYSPNFVKATATMGYLHFAPGFSPERLYANVVNNGLLASTVDAVTLTPPIFALPPDFPGGQDKLSDLPATNRVALGANAHFEVFATPDVTNYQWYSNAVAVTGATTYFLDVPNVQAGYDGSIYQVVASNAAGSSNSVACRLTVVSAANYYHPVNLWTRTANTVALTDGTNYITSNGGSSTPNERCIAYNALSNQLLVVRGLAAAGFPNMRISVINPDNGYFLYTLKTNGMSPGQNVNLAGIGVADDGAVYAATAGSDKSFKVYRWANTDPNTLPVVIFGTNSTAPYWQGGTGAYNPVQDEIGDQTYRFGDNLAVHGAGNNTEIVMDGQNITKYAAILRPVPDGTMTNWTQTGYILQNIAGSYGFEAYGTTIGRSLQFGPSLPAPPNNTPEPTFWQKRYNNPPGAPMAIMGYSVGGGLAVLDQANFSQPFFTNGPVGINFSLNLAAAVNFVGAAANNNTAPDTLDFYDLSDPSQGVLLSRQNLPGSNAGGHTANANAIAQVIFGYNPATGTNYLFAIDPNNGIAAYYLSGGVTPPPKILAQPSNVRILQGGSGSLDLEVDQVATLTWFKGTNPPVSTGIQGAPYTITHAQLSDAGDYFVVATNLNGAVTSQVAHVTIGLPGDNYTLSKVWAATPNNSSFPYVTSTGGANTPTERSFAFNALSNQLIVLSCPPASHNFTIYAVDATYGTNYYILNTNGIVYEGTSEISGSNPLDVGAVAVADDGAVYICNMSPNSSGGQLGDTNKMFHIYRWADSGPNTAPTVVFQGDPSGQPASQNERWGDVLAARGSGTNTELIVNSFDGIYGALIKPADSTVTQFTNYSFYDSGGAGSIGRSIQFGTTNTVFEKRKSTVLAYSRYATNTPATTVLYDSDFGSSTLGGVFVDTAHNVAAGVDFVGSTSTPDAVALYDVTDPATPMLLAHYNFPVNENANANFICQTVVAGWKVYSLDANNGLLAFYINPPVNSMVLHIAGAGANVNLSWGDATAVLQGTTSLNPPAWGDLTSPGLTNSLQPATGGSTFYRLIQRR